VHAFKKICSRQMNSITRLHPLLANAFKNPNNDLLFLGVFHTFRAIQQAPGTSTPNTAICNASKSGILLGQMTYMIGENEKWTLSEHRDVTFRFLKEIDSFCADGMRNEM